jgi:hypothetical protein
MSRWKKCKVTGCLRPAKAREFCDAHYNRLTKGYGLRPERPVRALERKRNWILPDPKKKPATTR